MTMGNVSRRGEIFFAPTKIPLAPFVKGGKLDSPPFVKGDLRGI